MSGGEQKREERPWPKPEDDPFGIGQKADGTVNVVPPDKLKEELAKARAQDEADGFYAEGRTVLDASNINDPLPKAQRDGG